MKKKRVYSIMRRLAAFFCGSRHICQRGRLRRCAQYTDGPRSGSHGNGGTIHLCDGSGGKNGHAGAAGADLG